MMFADVSATQWLIGWIVAGVLLLVVVLLLAATIYLAARIRHQLEAIAEALVEARDNTRSLWEVQATMNTAEQVLSSAREIRSGLEG